MSITVIVSPAKAGRFHASVEGRHLGTFRTPLLSAARVLLGEGIEPSTPITMRHVGATFDALRSTVGAAAKITVTETDSGRSLPRFAPYKSFSHGALSDAGRTRENRPSPLAATQHHSIPDLAEIDGHRVTGSPPL